jgi:MFS family permease
MGGVIATFLAGILANHAWNYAFLVYLAGVLALALVVAYLPNERLGGNDVDEEESGPESGFGASIRKFHPSVLGMLLCMGLFFVYPGNFAISTGAQTKLSSNSITLMMVGLDLMAFFVGLGFGRLMKYFRRAIKYFAPAGFIIGYSFLAFSSQTWSLVAGSLMIGIANGAGIPYLNTIASIKGGKKAMTTVMPLISASLYLGQFLSPILISGLGTGIFGNISNLSAPYEMAVIFGLIYLVQVFCTRHFQSLPPTGERIDGK